MANKNKDFYNYFSQNLIKGFVYLLVLIGLVIIFKSTFKSQYDVIEHAVSDSYYLMFFIFLISEFFVGILPPELFMIWSSDDPWHYYLTAVTTMTLVSLFAGWLNYRIGKRLGEKEFFMNFVKKRLKFDKYQQRYEQYGSGLIIVSALTPLPFALVSMLTGTLAYPQKKYLMFASFRIIRFVVYGIIVWNLEGVI
ncbi:YqaA family protein [Roseivirga sp. E12]|uniref:YqaA family protein n=1 Tax=Roseivirga sp. E12 TaxID=2819237 RepID=UPI001ABC6901|nr:VTT domain-containing protein [Roseivirga sp. E12]MBO3697199.1 VTT domain-containing protein [Roseivirga sp. E12]